MAAPQRAAAPASARARARGRAGARAPRTRRRAARARARVSEPPARRTLQGRVPRPGSDEEAALISAEQEAKGGRAYINATGFPFPLAPFGARRTVRREVVRGKLWAFEQEQGIGLGLGVSNLVRMTAVRLASGGIVVHAPVAPTAECVALLDALGGEVEAVVLPTTLYEHKIFLAPFARRYPRARVYVAPGQFSFPVDLPLPLLGVFGAEVLSEDDAGTPWEGEMECRILRPPALVGGTYRYCEAAFFVRATRTLLITDAAVYVPAEAPEIVGAEMVERTGSDDNVLLRTLKAINYGGGFRKRAEELEAREALSPAEVVRRGWQRICLFALYIAPAGESILEPQAAFDKVAGRWLVGPIVWSLVFKNVAPSVAAWADEVCEWDFTNVMPCHFAGPVRATPEEFREAFDFADAGEVARARGSPAEGIRRARKSFSRAMRRLGVSGEGDEGDAGAGPGRGQRAEGPELDAARDEYYLDSIGRDDVATLAGVSGALEKIGLLRRAR